MIRNEVRYFAELMEKALRNNDYKGGWQKCTRHFLLRKLREEVQELEKTVGRRKNDLMCPDAIAKEAADVANIAMMLANNFGEEP
jgi:NTP pyrophosphatase (non-canonical NTP hydrolase)